MKKKNWILTGLATIPVASFFLIIGFSSQASSQKDNATCCSQKSNKCDAKANSYGSGEMILDNLSRQFLSMTSLGY